MNVNYCRALVEVLAVSRLPLSNRETLTQAVSLPASADISPSSRSSSRQENGAIRMRAPA